MEYGVHCDKPMTTLTLTIEDTTEVKYGDVNGDGKVASTDAAIVYRYSISSHGSNSISSQVRPYGTPPEV